jgi:hypothetical protein
MNLMVAAEAETCSVEGVINKSLFKLHYVTEIIVYFYILCAIVM